MSFQQGLSGLNATSKNLEVIGNNIANAGTYGAKSARAEFGDMYATAINGAGSSNVGIGVNLLTVATLLFNRMLAATVVVEAVFAIPGMGNLIVNAALTRDLPVVQGVVFVMVLVVISINLAADLLYTVLDPRIQ